MQDNLKKKQSFDGKKINVNEPWEIEYWSRKFSCSPMQLRKAVEEMGTSAKAIEKFLKKSKP